MVSDLFPYLIFVLSCYIIIDLLFFDGCGEVQLKRPYMTVTANVESYWFQSKRPGDLSSKDL